jgi:hypothetical protein
MDIKKIRSVTHSLWLFSETQFIQIELYQQVLLLFWWTKEYVGSSTDEVITIK